MKKLYIALLTLMATAHAMASGGTQILGPRLKIASADQSVSTYPLVIQFPNGSASNSGSTATISFVLDAGDEGSFIGNFSTINCVGAGIVCTKSGNILTLTVSASGGGGGGGGGVWIATTAFQFNQNVSTIIFVGAFVDSAAYATNLATITISGTPFWNYSSTADARMTTISLATGTLQSFKQTPIVAYNGGSPIGTMTVISAGTNITLSMSGTTVTIAAASGGGGGAGGLWVSSTALQFNQPVSTIVFLGVFVDSIGYQNGVASVTISGAPFWNYAATADLRMNGFSTQNSTTDARLSAITQSTTDIQAFYAGYTSTADLRMLGFNSQNSTTDVVIAALLGDTNSISADIVNLTYYLHSETTGTNSAFQLLLSSPSNLAEITKTQNVTLAGGLIKISSHVTRDIEPGVRKIPAGLWTSVTWASVGTLGGATQLVVSIATASYDLTTVTEILSATSPAITATSPERFDLVSVQTSDIMISTSDRILVQYSARTTLGLGTNVSIYIAGTSHPSHLNTPVGGVYKFVQLADTPQTLVGSQGKYLSVNADQTTTVFVTSITDSFNAYTATADSRMNAFLINGTGVIQSTHTTGLDYSFHPFSGATNYIQNTDVLQAYATFYVSSGTIRNIVVSSGLNFNLADNPLIGGATSPVILISTGGTPLLFFNRTGHLSLGAPPSPVNDSPLVVYSTLAAVGPATSEFTGAKLTFVTAHGNSGGTSAENVYGLKTVLNPGIGSISTNGNYAVIVASFSNDAYPIQTGYSAGFDSQLTWSAAATTSGSMIGINKNIFVPGINGTINTGIFGDKTNISVTANGQHVPSTYGSYMDIADSGSGVNGRHSTYWLYLNSLTSTLGNTWGIYENVTGAKNYFAGKVGISTDTPNRSFEVNNGSVASLGSASGLYLSSTVSPGANVPYFNTSFGSTTIHGGVDLDSATIGSTLTVRGPIVSVGQFVLNGGTFTSAIVFPDGSIQKTAASAPGAGSADNMGTHVATKPIDVTNFGIVNVGSMSAVTTINGQVRVSSYPYVDWPISASRLHSVQSSTLASGGSDGLAISSMSANNLLHFDYFPMQNAATHTAYFQMKLPDSWDGSTVAFNVDWYASSGTTANNVVFALQLLALSSGSAINTAYGSSVAVITSYQAANQIARTPTSASITVGGNPTKNCMVYGLLYRLGADGRDGLTAFANIMGLNLRFREISNSDEERSP